MIRDCYTSKRDIRPLYVKIQTQKISLSKWPDVLRDWWPDAPLYATDELIRAIGHIAKARGMSQIAQESGLGRESLYKTFAPGAKPRFDTIAKVVKSLGLHFQITPLKAS